MILLIDNYDSFVHNLARYFQRLDQETLVLRNDATSPEVVRRLRPDAIVISPGPCTPQEAGCSVPVIRELADEIPILGICLGHQAIAEAFGGKVARAAKPRHGKTSLVNHDSSPLFTDISSPFSACRYHSLIIDEASRPAELLATARADDDCIMAVQHQQHAVFGLQFHPEAILSEYGYRLLANFLTIAGRVVTADPAALAASECRVPAPPVFLHPSQPVTF